MDQITHDVRSPQWLEIITQCQNRPEGTTAKQWMADNGISEKSYYYWLLNNPGGFEPTVRSK